jgi:transglutaminase-like putative cysteine protease
VALVAASQALAAGNLLEAATPAWVSDLPIPAPRPERLRQVEDGVYYLVDDTQVRPDGDEAVTYYRSVYKITDREGLENGASWNIEFDPSEEDIVLHHIRILRDGQVIDRLAETRTQVVERESDLDNGVINGLKTAHLEIKDVRVGDVVDSAYSRVSRPQLWRREFFDRFRTHWSVPMESWRYRLLWPADRPLSVAEQGAQVPHTETRLGGMTQYEWRATDPDPTESESGTPKWYATWGQISLSSVMSWSRVVEGMLPLYTTRRALPPELAEQAQSIAKTYADDRDRITQALRLVQDRWRYVSLSIGVGSIVPRDPAEVVRSGFGDCKDKALLLATMLGAMGIEAYPALTHTEKGRMLPHEAPSPYAFDHAIVEVRYRGHSYWLDPTRSHQGGRFPDLAGVLYVWALPLAPGQKTLESIADPEPVRPTYRTVEQYDLPASRDGSLSLGVETTYLGADADWMRGNVASKSPAAIEREYLDFYNGLYPGLKRARPIRISDDRDANRIVVRESYSLRAALLDQNALDRTFPVKASSLNDFDDKPDDGRTTPFGISSPVNKLQTIVLVTPGRRPPAPKGVLIDGAGFKYSLRASRNADTLTLDYSLTGTRDAIAPDQIGRYRSEVDSVKDANYWEADLAASADAATPQSADGRIYRRLILSLALMAACTVVLYALYMGLHVDDHYAGTGHFYPVPAPKFLVMSIATAGVYPIFWAWKCWRWLKRQDRRTLQPFWRACFSVFWLYPLFDAANSRLGTTALPRMVGSLAALCYLSLAVVAEVLYFLYPRPIFGIAFVILAPVFFLPAVLAVNRLNDPSSIVVQENTKVTGLTLMAVLGGILNWCVLLGVAVTAVRLAS